MDFIDWYFKNPNYTQLVQIVVSFVFGLILAPYGYGFIYFLIYLLAYEFVYLLATQGCNPYWGPVFRLGAVSASILGFLIGRIILGWKNPLRGSPNDP